MANVVRAAGRRSARFRGRNKIYDVAREVNGVLEAPSSEMDIAHDLYLNTAETFDQNQGGSLLSKSEKEARIFATSYDAIFWDMPGARVQKKNYVHGSPHMCQFLIPLRITLFVSTRWYGSGG